MTLPFFLLHPFPFTSSGGPMSAKSLDICSDVVTRLNGHTFTLSFSSEIALALNLESLDLSTLRVYVTPLTVETEWANRVQRFKTFTVAVSVFQHVQNVEAGFPALIELVEEIDTFLTDQANRVLTGPQAQLVESSSTIYDYASAEESSLFIGVSMAQYRVMV